MLLVRSNVFGLVCAVSDDFIQANSVSVLSESSSLPVAPHKAALENQTAGELTGIFYREVVAGRTLSWAGHPRTTDLNVRCNDFLMLDN